MVSVGLVFLLEYLDNTYKNKEQLEKDLGIPVLGAIPDVENGIGGKGEMFIVEKSPKSVAAEAYRSFKN